MENSNPKVSILSSCYNHVHFLEEFVLSVMSQDYSDFELIMIDDGSKDGSDVLLKSLSEKYGFKAIIRDNKGFPNALNTLRELALGEYIVIIASDDIMCPDRLERQVKFLEENKNLALVCGNMQEINERGDKGNLIRNPFINGFLFEEILLFNLYILAPTVMIRTSAIDKIGKYDESLHVEDFDMWLRLAKEFEFGYLDHLFAYYRKHSSNDHGNYKRSFEQKELVLKKYKTHTLYPQAIKKHLISAFVFLSGLKDFNDLANLYRIKIKPYGMFDKNIIKGLIKYYFIPKK